MQLHSYSWDYLMVTYFKYKLVYESHILVF